MAYSLPDWSSMLGFAWAIVASAIAWRQKDKRSQAAENTLNFLHGLKAAIQVAVHGQNQLDILEQIHDQMARIQPPVSTNKERWRAAGSGAAIALVGVVGGLFVAVCAVSFWPQNRVVPALLTVNSLRIGVDEDGKAALCDSRDKAYDVGVHQGPELIGRRMHDDPPEMVNGEPALRRIRQANCRPA
ncbi:MULTISPECIES: hypothetical protein [Paraburkholderia]|uniref:Uncharacterized protein n=1 Tax=Paraburkholderia metrosideri TaxID=580937 RepID=A0ABW9E4J5_9BURK